jgi:hypothetical protein
MLKTPEGGCANLPSGNSKIYFIGEINNGKRKI